MSTPENKPTVYSLVQIAEAIKRAINTATGSQSYWIKAEIATLNISGSGHAYLELVEQRNGKKIAVVKGVIWAAKMQELKQTLGSDFGNIIKAGTEFVANCNVEYHVVYGLQIQILDIDLSFNIGELERRKKETIARLKKEELFDLNRQVREPLIIQKVALIASPQSAAYQDFIKHIKENEHNYRFDIQLFPVTVQGDTSAQSMRDALSKINPAEYEAVVFIRGGGSELDLDPFNDYELCKMAAMMPIPILTGIGHEINLSVLDMIACVPQKTPTAIADYLIDKILSYEKKMYELYIAIARRTNERLKIDQLKIGSFLEIISKYPVSYCQKKRGDIHTVASQLARIGTKNIVDQKEALKFFLNEIFGNAIQRLTVVEPNRLNEIAGTLQSQLGYFIRLQSNSLEQLHESVQILRPENTLARGFSITRLNGKAIRGVDGVNYDDNIEITLFDGTINAKVKSIKKDGNRKPIIRERLS